MPFADKTLKCSECGSEFVFAASEQQRFQQLGYTNEPKRCPTCREARRDKVVSARGNRGGGRNGAAPPVRPMHAATCSDCGKECQVPFKPRGDKPVYCSDCYRKRAR